MSGSAHGSRDVEVTPTEGQVAAALRPIRRGGVSDSLFEDLVMEVEFWLPHTFRTREARAKAVARLINELDLDPSALKDCKDDGARLQKAKTFLKTAEGKQWVARRTCTSGNVAIVVAPECTPAAVLVTQQTQRPHNVGLTEIAATSPQIDPSVRAGTDPASSGSGPSRPVIPRSVSPDAALPHAAGYRQTGEGNGQRLNRQLTTIENGSPDTSRSARRRSITNRRIEPRWRGPWMEDEQDPYRIFIPEHYPYVLTRYDSYGNNRRQPDVKTVVSVIGVCIVVVMFLVYCFNSVPRSIV